MYRINTATLLIGLAGLGFIGSIIPGCAEGADNGNNNNQVSCSNGSIDPCTCDDGRTGTRQCVDEVYTLCSCEAEANETGSSGNANSETMDDSENTVSYAENAATNTKSPITTTDAIGAAGVAGSVGGAGVGDPSDIDTSIIPTTAPDSGATEELSKTCPSRFTCESNDKLNSYLDAGPTEAAKFCASTNQTIYGMSNFGPTPPMCISDVNCEAAGLNVKCTRIDIGGLIFSGCLAGCQ